MARARLPGISRASRLLHSFVGSRGGTWDSFTRSAVASFHLADLSWPESFASPYYVYVACADYFRATRGSHSFVSRSSGAWLSRPGHANPPEASQDNIGHHTDHRP